MIDAAFRDAHRISPSQIETARLCLRKWGLEKLDKLPKKPNKYADRGTAAHNVLEIWQRDGIPVDLATDIGKMVSAGLKFLPQPKTHKTEHNFVFDSGVAVFHGKMDLRGPVSFRIQSIWDHKTTSSFHWLKPPEVLRADPQANIYAKAVIEECKKAGFTLGNQIDRVEQNWVYYLADPSKPKSRKVQLHVLPDGAKRLPERPEDVKKEHFGIMHVSELEERFSECEDTAKQLLQLYHDRPSGLDLPYDTGGCSAFGGCPYKDNPCKLSYSERWRSMEAKEEGKKLSMADKMKARALEQGAGAGTPAASTQTKAAAAQPTTQTAAPNGAGETAANGAGTQTDLPRVNAPEQKHGVDPDAPAAGTRSGSAVGSAYGRTEIAALMAQGLVAARVYSVDDNRYPVKVAKEAVQLADALLAALAS